MCIGSPLRANEQGAATTLGTCEFNQAVLIGQRTTRKLEAVGQIDAKRPKPRKCIQPCPHSSPRRPYRANVRVADDTGVESLWSTRVYGGVLLRVLSKAGTDGPCELLEVALAPDVLPQLRRARVGCMLVVARCHKGGFWQNLHGGDEQPELDNCGGWRVASEKGNAGLTSRRFRLLVSADRK